MPRLHVASMNTRELFHFSLGAILAHRLRSMLTVLGIVVGIAAVVFLTSIGEGVRQFILGEFTQFGTNLVAVVPGKSNTFGTSGATISSVRPLSLEDAIALERVPQVKAVVPVIMGNAAVEFRGRERRTNVFGVGPDMPEVWRMSVSTGRFLPADDYRAPRAFVVLGAKMQTELFRAASPLGERVRVGGSRYRVVGVMAEKGQMLGFDLDDTIFMPVSKALELFDREGLMEIDVLYEPGSDSEQIAAAIKRLMIARHGHEDFTIITQDKMLDVLDSVLNVVTLGIGALGGISLLVGAVGILTIMTIAVAERTGEIGLLRALGMRRRDVLRAFLTEALLLGCIGGVIGIALAVGAVLLIGAIAPSAPLGIPWRYVVIAFILSLVIGLLAGVLPALRAARLQPLEALRTE